MENIITVVVRVRRDKPSSIAFLAAACFFGFVFLGMLSYALFSGSLATSGRGEIITVGLIPWALWLVLGFIGVKLFIDELSEEKRRRKR